MNPLLEAFPDSLISHLNTDVPRYTSYPSADRFKPFSGDAYRYWLQQRGSAGANFGWRPLSVYLHLPFCRKLCHYCACSKTITQDRKKTSDYLIDVVTEIDLVSRDLGGSHTVSQIHFGGGTPTYYSTAALAGLLHELRAKFQLEASGEFSIEVDPRSVSEADMHDLAGAGFNRVSLGVQDFSIEVQRAIGRIQSFAMTQRIFKAARTAGIESINLDLVYGLPEQTAERFAKTLEQTVDLGADRIALFSYAHLPERFRAQKLLEKFRLPGPLDKAGLMLQARRKLLEEGYVAIGMDHFAKPSDKLARAKVDGRLQRNFQGYSTHADADLIGIGVSAISRIGPVYAQNSHRLPFYRDALQQGKFATERGLVANRDDLVRRSVIMALMCDGFFSKQAIGAAHLIDFDQYFSVELRALERFCPDGYVEMQNDWIAITPRGYLLLRLIAAVFDRHRRHDLGRALGRTHRITPDAKQSFIDRSQRETQP